MSGPPFSFGTASQAQLDKAHADLRRVLERAIQVVDFSVIETARTIEAQIRNIRRGVSKTIDSRHIPRDADGLYDPAQPSIAADCDPYQKGVKAWPQDGDSTEVRQKKLHRWYYMQGVFLAMAHEEGVHIRQGVDWDMDRDFFDQTFDDLPHVELHVPWPKLKLSPEQLEAANDALTSRGLPPYENP